jgi:hypothetical protein
MRPITAPTLAVEPETVVAAAYRVVAHPWRTFVREWNWKAALLSALFRTILFSGAALQRNLSKRVEVVAPILAAEAKERLWEILDISLQDRREAWVLGEDGKFTQLRPEGAGDAPEAVGSHETLMELARRRSE